MTSSLRLYAGSWRSDIISGLSTQRCATKKLQHACRHMSSNSARYNNLTALTGAALLRSAWALDTLSGCAGLWLSSSTRLGAQQVDKAAAPCRKSVSRNTQSGHNRATPQALLWGRPLEQRALAFSNPLVRSAISQMVYSLVGFRATECLSTRYRSPDDTRIWC